MFCLTKIETWLRAWLAWWHGIGEAHQIQFFRCKECRRLVTWRRIRLGGCLCGSAVIRPAVLLRREKARLLLLPWTV